MNKKGIKTIVGIFRFIKERFVGNKKLCGFASVQFKKFLGIY